MEPLRLSDGRAIPDAELLWTFARASGPGGQSVNTTDSAVRLAWNVADSTALQEPERQRVLARLAARRVGDTIVVTAREHRSQWANRSAAAARLVQLVDAALAPGPSKRRQTKPSASSRARRLQGKRARSEVKRMRRPPGGDA